jgi:hypothetical protein
MIIEIRRPELQALILERMERGAYESVEDVLMQALLPSPPANGRPIAPREDSRTGVDLIAAMQASPYREISIEPGRYRVPVRDVTF